MILIKAKDNIINAGNVQGIVLIDNTIEFQLPEDKCYKAEYGSDALARAAFDKLFLDLAETQGIEGAVLSGDFV